MRLKNKIAIVTGAASGFGEGIARLYAAEGAKVAVADINGEGALAVAMSIGANAVGVRCDVTKRTDIDGLVKATREAFGGRIDIVGNNAGFPHGLKRRIGRKRCDRLAFTRDVPLTDTGAIDDPGIVRLQAHRGNIGVRDDPGWHCVTGAGDIRDRPCHAAFPDVAGVDSASRRPISSVIPDS